MTDEHRAWTDWLRVEACVFFGVRRWLWFALAVLVIQYEVRPIAEWLAMLTDMLAFGLQVAYLRRDDARRALR